MKLTREIVDKLLEANTKNRNVSPHHVSSLARFMREGLFVPNNGQTIVVNESFTWLLDGQHRLLAIREAGYPVFDIDVKIVGDEEAQRIFETIDCNRNARTPGQILALENIPNAKAISAVIRHLAIFAWGKQRINVAEIKRCMGLLADEISRIHIATRCLKRPVAAAIQAGVVNAMLICPNEKNRIEEDWLSVLGNSVEGDKPSLSSLLTMIVTHTEPLTTMMFLKATKAMLYPTKKCLKITADEDTRPLRSKAMF